MTPEERQQFKEMKQTLDSLVRVENVPFIESIKRRLDVTALVTAAIGKTNIGTLLNVDDTGITNGQLLKWNSSTELYEPANDIDT